MRWRNNISQRKTTTKLSHNGHVSVRIDRCERSYRSL